MGMFDDIIAEESARHDGRSRAPRGGGLFDDIVNDELAREAGPSDQPSGDQRGSFLDAMGQGLSFGFGDEIAGAVSGAVDYLGGGSFQEGYAQTRDELRDNYAAYRERRPYTAMAGEFIGALPSAVVPGLNVARSASLGQAAWRGARAGALGGAIYGAGQGESEAGRLGGAATGAAFGAGIGGALPVAGAAVGRTAQAAKDLIAPNPAVQAGLTRGAQRVIREDLNADGVAPHQLANALRRYGPEATPADGSPSLRTEAEALVNYGRPGAAALEATMRDRARRANTMVQQGFDEFMGPRPDLARDQRVLEAWQRRNAGRAYGRAERAAGDAPINVDPRAKPQMDRVRRKFASELRDYADAPDDSYRFVSEAQKRMNQDARGLETSAVGSERSRSGMIKASERLLVDALDEATDGQYSAAMGRYKSDANYKEAIGYGRKALMSNSEDASFVIDRIKNASPEELSAIRRGARSALGARVAQVRGGSATRNALLMDGTDLGEKVRLIFGDDVHSQVLDRMAGIEEMAKTNAVVSRTVGSRTSRMQASRHNPDRGNVPLDTGMTGLALRGGQALANALAGGLMRPSGKTAESLSRFLGSQGDQRDLLVKALMGSIPTPAPGKRALVEALLADGPVRAAGATVRPEEFKGTRVTVRP